VLAVAALDIYSKGLLDHLDWLSCPIDVLNAIVFNLLHGTVIKFIKSAVDGYFYIFSLGFFLEVLDFFCHWTFLFHCLAVGVLRAEEIFKNSEGISIVGVASYLVWSLADAVTESSITVSVVKSSMTRVAEDLVSFTNSTEIQLELGHFRLFISQRMVLQCQLAVGLSDVFFLGIRLNLKSVIILVACHFKLFIIINQASHQR